MNARIITAPVCTSFYHLEDNHLELNLPAVLPAVHHLSEMIHQHLVSNQVLTLNPVNRGLAFDRQDFEGCPEFSFNFMGGQAVLLSELIIVGNAETLPSRQGIWLMLPEFFTEPVYLVSCYQNQLGLYVIHAVVNPGDDQLDITLTWEFQGSGNLVLNLFSGALDFSENAEPLAIATVTEELLYVKYPPVREKQWKWSNEKEEPKFPDGYSYSYKVDGTSPEYGASAYGAGSIAARRRVLNTAGQPETSAEHMDMQNLLFMVRVSVFLLWFLISNPIIRKLPDYGAI